MITCTQNEIPNEFLCPITLDIMRDPVICSDNFTYERSAILQIKNSISPLTRQPIDKNNLISNVKLKELIHNFCQENKIILSPLDQLYEPTFKLNVLKDISNDYNYFTASVFCYKNIIGLKIKGLFENQNEIRYIYNNFSTYSNKFNILCGIVGNICAFDVEFVATLNEDVDLNNEDIDLNIDYLEEDVLFEYNGILQKYCAITLLKQNDEITGFNVLNVFSSNEEIERYLNNASNNYNDIYIIEIGKWTPILRKSNLNLDLDNYAGQELNKYIGKYLKSLSVL